MVCGGRFVGILVLIATMGLLTGCSRRPDPVDAAKEFVQQAVRDDKQAGRVAGLDSERYLPVQERLRRRQERLGAALASQQAPVDARRP
ncbi:MAG: hypothetical protein N2111_10880 [Candidatus Sumerlaeaceae bacterium]|nr:hypothetical protein [Candidatus Sumerlaeaceae bacterium]